MPLRAAAFGARGASEPRENGGNNADANLVWHNCLQFNPPGDPVSVACCELRQHFNNLWHKASLPLHPAPNGPVLPPQGGSAAAAAPPRADKKRKAPPLPPPPPPFASGGDDEGDHGGGSATRCAVCASQRKGNCGTPMAPARCERRTPGMPVVAPPKRARTEGAGSAQPQRASSRPHASVEAAPSSAAAVAAREKAARELAAAQEALRDAQARLAAALAAEGAARDAVRGMRPHDAPEPQLAPPGWAQPTPRATAQTHALASFWWGLRRAQPPARAA